METKVTKVIKKSTKKLSTNKPKVTVKSSADKKPLVKISATVEQSLHGKIKQYIKKNNTSINALISLAVKSYIK